MVGLIVLSLFGVVGAGGLWLVHRTTGRPYRDMVALLLGGVVLVIIALPVVLLFYSYGPLPVAQQWLVHEVQTFIFLAFAILACWALNRWGKRGSRPGGRGRHKRSHFTS